MCLLCGFRRVIYGGSEPQERSYARVVPWTQIHSRSGSRRANQEWATSKRSGPNSDLCATYGDRVRTLVSGNRPSQPIQLPARRLLSQLL